jgi:hypothetical protein
MKKNIKLMLLIALTVVACNKKDDEVVAITNSSDGLALTAGTANFSKYVAVGNSLSAGYSDGALFKEAQKTSWTAILAEQFKLVGGGEFKIPFMADNTGGFLKTDGSGLQDPNYSPRRYLNTLNPAGSTPELLPMLSLAANSTVLTGGFNNMGVPGAKVWHLNTAGYGTLNPYFGRFASTPMAKIIDDAVAQSPTFFSLWIGNNDVLSYASSGGIGADGGFGINDITDPVVFQGAYGQLLNDATGLRKNGAKGVLSNIPYVTSVPFFTRVPTNPVGPLPAANITALNNLFGSLNAFFAGAPFNDATPRFATLTTNDNPLLIVDESLPSREAAITGALASTLGPLSAQVGKILAYARHARKTAGDRDYVLLTTSGVIGKTINDPLDLNTTVAVVPAAPIFPSFSTLGVSYPLQDRHVLTADETLKVKTATDAYNTTIKTFADQYGLAFVNANSILASLSTTGYTSNGYTVKAEYVTGGGFSLDGVHPSPRGYAVLANEFIKSINTTYGSNLKGVNLGDYRILFPKNL